MATEIMPDESEHPNDLPEARISSSHYEPSCGLLSFRVYLKNPGEKPIYLVSDDFAFLHGHPFGQGHKLVVRQDHDELILDLSHTVLTDDGYRYFRSELGAYGFVPEVIELGPRTFRYITYAFQFPLRLDSRVSDTEKVLAPLEERSVRLRFGYGREPYGTFKNREFRQSYTIEGWQGKIVSDWQEYIEAGPTNVPFSK